MPEDDAPGPPSIPAQRPPSEDAKAPLNAVTPAGVGAPAGGALADAAGVPAAVLPAESVPAPADAPLAPAFVAQADAALAPAVVAQADAAVAPAFVAQADAALAPAFVAPLVPASVAPLVPASVAPLVPASVAQADVPLAPPDAPLALADVTLPPADHALFPPEPTNWLPAVMAGHPAPYALGAGPSALRVSEPAVGPGGRLAAVRIMLAGAVAVAVLASIGFIFGDGRERSAQAEGASSSARPGSVAPGSGAAGLAGHGSVAPGLAGPTGEYRYPPVAERPFEAAARELQRHGAALVDGDEAGWMAVVDPGKPALVAQYRGLFRTLRALGVTRFSYTPGISVIDKKDPSAFTFPARVDYCFGADTCGGGDPAAIGLSLTMKNLGGRYVITAVRDRPEADNLGPVPWQDGKLQVVKGQRVVVGADASEAPYLARILPIAEKAAAADEPFAGMLLARQSRYRVFLAGEEQWRRWYGGKNDKWVIGYATPISQYGYDVVLRVRRIESPTELRVTLQHEFGHVITLTGTTTYHDRDEWLREGVAEYIGWSPKHATDSYRRRSVEWSIAGKRPASMIPAQPRSDASARAGDAYYGLSHFAVDCLAQKYGQPKMLRFVRLVLLRDESYEDAARDAFGQPFAKVDKACAAWIRQKA
ncbi:hypothetical protein ACQP2F_37165 [Actinoplanes sp. CA-030573]|uniref:hypothetical protein n=1 Tax=Actinoplanes sp. CA-030573 TaxID=3239898 RepID=UPI003D8A25B0